MRQIATFDSADYCPPGKIFSRVAARAIIWYEQKIVMITSKKYGEIKFPGGGLNEQESPIAALIRETREETGLQIIENSIREYGRTSEKRRLDSPQEIYQQESLYYECAVREPLVFSPQNLDDYEIEYGYEPRLFSPAAAIAGNEECIRRFPAEPVAIWAAREIAVLTRLRDREK